MTIKGVWWLPEKEEKKIDGTLDIFVNGTAKLELSIPIGEPISEEPFGSGDIILSDAYYIFSIILGKDDTGKKITLYNCYGVDIKVSEESILQNKGMSVKVTIVFLGEHFKKVDEIKFESICTIYPYLTENIPKETTLGYCSETFKICFSKYDKGTKITIKAEKKISYSYFYAILTRLGRLLSFILCMTIKLIEISGESNNNEVQIYRKRVDDALTTDDYNVLFSYSEIPSGLGDLLERWMKQYENNKNSLDLYFRLYLENSIHLEADFITLTQAVEAYCSKTVQKDKNIDDNTLSKIKEAIKTPIEKLKILDNQKILERINGLLDLLKYNNLKSLLKGMLEKKLNFGEVWKVFFKSSKEKDNFINDICKQRNEKIHSDKKSTHKTKKIIESIFRLRRLLEFYFLMDIGFPDDKAKKIIIRKLNADEEMLKKMIEHELFKDP